MLQGVEHVKQVLETLEKHKLLAKQTESAKREMFMNGLPSAEYLESSDIKCNVAR